MQLSKIKLSGFKSFVDPTTISFPSNLVAVVGPNGCGKSNVIDAVRWVMGESSATRLRGDSIADVIFNGSSSRKPIGKASVELLFDNSDATLSGEYAKYNEISIRREVSRDGISKYYLNNTRCRRKDITSIFLGTGLGPRSYSIIEQGMISRLVEAKPEEMRVFVEEAAGISKYKERRKETSNRIKHTKENLCRLEDVIDEVENHLKHLQKQARAAKRYTKMKEDERKISAEHFAIRLREIKELQNNANTECSRKQTILESFIAEQRTIEAAIEVIRVKQSDKQEIFNDVQARFYKTSSEIAKIEQSIEYAADLKQRHRKDLELTIQNTKEISDHIKKDTIRISQFESSLSSLTSELEQSQKNEKQSAVLLKKLIEEMRELREEDIKLTDDLDNHLGTMRVVENKFASINAIQKAALGETNESINGWLKNKGLSKSKRVANSLEVQKGWENAVETVLGGYLQAICVTDIDDAVRNLISLKSGEVSFIDKNYFFEPHKHIQASLSSKVKNAPAAVISILDSVLIIESYEKALELRKKGFKKYSFVTKEGLWVGAGWLRVKRDSDEDPGLLVRKEQLKNLAKEIQGINEIINNIKKQLKKIRQRQKELDDELEKSREKFSQNRNLSQEITIKIENKKSTKEFVNHNLDRMKKQLSHFSSHENEIQEQIDLGNQPITNYQKDLDEQLKNRLDIESKLSAFRKDVEKIEIELRETDQKRMQKEQDIEKSRQSLNDNKIELEALRVRYEGLFEQFTQTEFELDHLLDSLDKSVTVEEWNDKLERIRSRINRLGPINLAAIDEQSNQSERKEYLDSQLKDLKDALSTLEGAIKKIDRETKHRFSETFNKINSGFKDLFPKLFGGGHAYIELTSEDLLSTGVTVMARPPGKRNSNINLLSGGEKALAAVALVFAIFKLNPAPFCLLDEVDAPLDDTNVNRFCDIVEEMSKKVQFVIITHNKVTMELARQLLGVTMQEAGVSRMVSVDIDEAVQMVAN